MTGSAYIRPRTTTSGERRYDVRYRIGGRGFQMLHGGTFRALADAKRRQAFVMAELAAGRDPRETLSETLGTKPRRSTVLAATDSFIAARVDVSERTRAGYRDTRRHLGSLATLDPHEVEPADVREWLASIAHFKRGTLAHHLSVLGMVLDHVEVEPNPARSARVRLPHSPPRSIHPPSGEEWVLIRENLPRTYSLGLRLVECCGLRIEEMTELTWGDLDFVNRRLRVAKERTKGRTAGQRWLRVPDALLEEMQALVPFEDRHRLRRVFPQSKGSYRAAQTTACRDAGVAHYSPHKLRHRRLTLWVLHGIDPLTASLWSGHSNREETLNTYGHVLLTGEDEWRDFWVGVYRDERLPTREVENADA